VRAESLGARRGVDWARVPGKARGPGLGHIITYYVRRVRMKNNYRNGKYYNIANIGNIVLL